MNSLNKTFYFIRHTAVYNPKKLCFGESEVPLEENFTVQFDWLREQLKLSKNTLYFSSPRRRCTKLASYLSNDNFLIEERIKDLNFGNWEMKEWSKIPSKDLKLWEEDFVNFTPKKGENFTNLWERSVDFYNEACHTASQENIVVITHAGVIRCLLSYVLDFPLENAFNLQINYSSITKLVYDTEQNTSTVAFTNLNAASLAKPAED